MMEEAHLIGMQLPRRPLLFGWWLTNDGPWNEILTIDEEIAWWTSEAAAGSALLPSGVRAVKDPEDPAICDVVGLLEAIAEPEGIVAGLDILTTMNLLDDLAHQASELTGIVYGPDGGAFVFNPVRAALFDEQPWPEALEHAGGRSHVGVGLLAVVGQILLGSGQPRLA